jgi:electron transport complex protein RnfC
MDVGVVVQNVGTAFAVYEALALNKPLIERVVTITGPGIEKPRNLLVRIGTLFSDVISQCGGFKKDVNVTKVISGGPMMGQAQFSLDVPVMKGTSGILVLTDEFKYEAGINPCIRCGKCVSACPMYLMPNELSQIGEFNRPDLAGQARVMDCVECGTCAYVCPSFRPIVQFIRYLKGEVAAAGQKAKAN